VICTASFPAYSWGSRSQAWPLGRWERPRCEIFQAIWPANFGIHTTLYTHAIALACAFALLSSLHVVIGELVPKTVSLARAERVALLVALPFHWFLKHFSLGNPFARSDIGCDRKGLGVSSAQVHGVAHSTEELQIQIQQARERGLIAPGEEKFILSAWNLRKSGAGDHGAAAGYPHAFRGSRAGRSDAGFLQQRSGRASPSIVETRTTS